MWLEKLEKYEQDIIHFHENLLRVENTEFHVWDNLRLIM